VEPSLDALSTSTVSKGALPLRRKRVKARPGARRGRCNSGRSRKRLVLTMI
jgi:hypothetical protein